MAGRAHRLWLARQAASMAAVAYFLRQVNIALAEKYKSVLTAMPASTARVKT